MKFDVRVILISFAALFGVIILAAAEDKPPSDSPVHLPQGWTPDTADRWHFISQGTAIFPYEWFLSLERPDQQPGQTELISAPENLQRLGFLAEPANATSNPDGLPVGLYKTQVDFPDGKHACWKGSWLGLGCAGCHTGQVNYRGQQIRIEGGPSHIDIGGLTGQLSAALAKLGDPQVAARFMARVKLPVPVVTAGLGCFAQLPSFPTSPGTPDTIGGAGRLDAHGAGLNQLLAGPLNEPRNYAPLTAPVRYPVLWDTPRFSWVLYNASIRQPLTRNLIEALGVQAPIKHDPTMLTLNVTHAVEMENVVWGQRALMDLRSPRWPDAILGAPDLKLAALGQALYAKTCANCHSVAPPAAGACDEIHIPVFDLTQIGTDPEQAKTFANRRVTLSKIGGPDDIANYDAARIVTGNVAEQWIAKSNDNAAAAAVINCGRPNEYRGLLQYRARPLNGVWAMAPYLHNGSVPSLHDLLLPPEQRPRTFFVGNWEFDPVNVGYAMASESPGAFKFDTTLLGNSNAGHAYGTDLNEDDRRALIEYLKTL
ncbi:cytochrome c [Bradyrhizobium arachidis]|uniref:cytochrome c n=1 Tax=Bradyrhizobium arachidis TaxID=858423 RepID=UPI0021630926|nr:cytochrome c [Bradyrhizobium arachidis]UVO38731.1 cytochrome c [Bradyrhizobium arachidis]